jgi:hypothetical protein
MNVERPLPGGGTSIDTRIASIFAGRPSRARSRAANSQPKIPKEVLRDEMFSPGISNYTMVDYPLLPRISVLGGPLALSEAQIAVWESRLALREDRLSLIARDRLRRPSTAFSELLRDLPSSSCYNPVPKWLEDLLFPLLFSPGLESGLQTYSRLSLYANLCELGDEFGIGIVWLGNYECRCDIYGSYPKYSSVDSPCWQDFYSTSPTVIAIRALSGDCLNCGTFITSSEKLSVFEVGPE